MELYTILYAFMATKLGLRGAVKEVFAVIFGFWQAKQEPITVPNGVIMSITGLSHASVVKAKNTLVAKKLITVNEIRGKPSIYEVVLPEDGSITLTCPPKSNKTSTLKTSPNSRPKINNNIGKNGNKNRPLIIGNQNEFEVPDQL